MRNIIIKDQQLEDKLTKDGYAVVKMLSTDDIGKIWDIYNKYHSTPDDLSAPWFNTFNRTADIRRPVANEIRSVFMPLMHNHFENFYLTGGIFFTKHQASNNEIGMHCDPTLLSDESTLRHINFWCPLQPANAENGGMHVIKGSHTMFPPVKAATVTAPHSQYNHLLEPLLEPVDVLPGEALVFDNRLLHSSTPNNKPGRRVAVITSIIPDDAILYSLYRNPNLPNAPIEVYEQSRDFYLDPLWSNNLNPPQTGKLIGHLDYPVVSLTEAEVIDAITTKKHNTPYSFKVLPLN